MQLGQGDVQSGISGFCLCLGLSADLSLVGGFCRQDSFPHSHGADSHGTLRDVGIIIHFFHIGLGHEFQPYRLPDSRGSGVVAAVGIEEAALLSLALPAAAGVVFCIERQHVFALFCVFCDVEAK